MTLDHLLEKQYDLYKVMPLWYLSQQKLESQTNGFPEAEIFSDVQEVPVHHGYGLLMWVTLLLAIHITCKFGRYLNIDMSNDSMSLEAIDRTSRPVRWLIRLDGKLVILL